MMINRSYLIVLYSGMPPAKGRVYAGLLPYLGSSRVVKKPYCFFSEHVESF